jgi:RNA polymerase sigma-70 factor (family 1)
MPQNLTDTKLIQFVSEGNREAFEALYHRHWSLLYRTAWKILDDREVAKDLVQEVFISLYENAGRKQIENVGGYLFQSIKYKCFMHIRAGNISEKHLHRMASLEASNVVEDEYNALELQHILEQGIAALPEKCREVFCLSRFEHHTNKYIAEQLNISTKTVEHQITKALKALRTSVERLAVLLPIFFQL